MALAERCRYNISLVGHHNVWPTDVARVGGLHYEGSERATGPPRHPEPAARRAEECAEGDEGLGVPVTPPGVRPALLVDASSRRRSPRWSCCNKQRRVGDVSLRDTSRSIVQHVLVDRRRCGDVVVDMVWGRAGFTPPTHLSLNHLGSSSDACRWG